MPDYIQLSDEEIEQALQSMPEWEYRDGWIRRLYKTPGWSHTLMLANTIGYLADAAYHHPDLALGYAQVIVKLQTHRVKGITQLDIALAKRIDEIVLWQPGEDSPFDGYPKTWVH